MTRLVTPVALTLSLAVALALAPRSASAQMGGMGGVGWNPNPPNPKNMKPYEVVIESQEGVTKGVLKLESVLLLSRIGQLEIKPEKVREIRFPERKDDTQIVYLGMFAAPVPATVVTRNGMELAGNVVMNSWKVETEIGTLTLTPGSIQRLTIAGGPLPTSDEEPKPKPKPNGEHGSEPKPKPNGEHDHR